MPYLTLTENLKLQLPVSPGLVAYYDIQPGNGVGLFWDCFTATFKTVEELSPSHVGHILLQLNTEGLSVAKHNIIQSRHVMQS